MDIEDGMRELANTVDENGQTIGLWAAEMHGTDGDVGNVIGYSVLEINDKMKSRVASKVFGYGTGYAHQLHESDVDIATERVHVDAALDQDTMHLHHHQLLAGGEESPLNKGGYSKRRQWAEENAVRDQAFRMKAEPPTCSGCGLYLEYGADENPIIARSGGSNSSLNTSDYGSLLSLSGSGDVKCKMPRQHDSDAYVANIEDECLQQHNARLARRCGLVGSTMTPAPATDYERAVKGHCKLGRIHPRPFTSAERRLARSMHNDRKGLHVGHEMIGGIRAGDACDRLQNNLMSTSLLTKREHRKIMKGQERLIQV